MAECILLQAGGGLDPDELTATAGDVLKGMLAGVKGYDDPVAGTLELTGTAADSQVLNGQTYYNTDAKTKRTGGMPNRGAWTGRIGVNGKAVIPAGYHNGAGYVDQSLTNRGAWTGRIGVNGKVTIPEGYHNGSGYVDQSITNRGAWASSVSRNSKLTIPEGYHNGSGYVNGPSMTDRGAATITPGKANQTIAAGQYLTGDQTILGDANLQPHNIRYGVTLFGMKGTFSGAATSPYEIFTTTDTANDKTGGLSLVQSNGYVNAIHSPTIPSVRHPYEFNCVIPTRENPSITATGRVNNAFNLAPYRYLKCGVSINDMQSATVTLGVSKNSAATSYTAQVLASQSGSLILDVTDLYDNYFVFLKINGTAFYISGAHSILDINSITLSDS